MEVGQSYVVKGFKDEQLGSKLIVLGFLPLTEFTFVRKSPFANTYYFDVNGNKIALRKSEAEAIEI